MLLRNQSMKGETEVYLERTTNSSTISASGILNYAPSEANRNIFKPFNRVTVLNLSEQNINLRIDGDSSTDTVLPANSNTVIPSLVHNNVRVENRSSTTAITATSVFVEWRKVI